MQRTWATGGDHDQGPMEWLAAISEGSTVEHIRDGLRAALADDATIEQCQIGLLAVECVTYLHGGDADLHPLVHAWMKELRPSPDETLRTLALEVLAKAGGTSPLAAWWHEHLPAGEARWRDSLKFLDERLRNAKRAPDPRLDPRILALRASYDDAAPHLRVALVPYAIEEPIATTLIAPALSHVLYYDVPELEPFPVPLDHVQSWRRKLPEIRKAAAKRTREVTEIRIHIMEHDGYELGLVFGGTTFTAGMMPFPELFFEGAAPHGSLVGAPFAGSVVFHRIVDAQWREAAVQVVQHLRELHEGSTDKISTQLYWAKGGKLVPLPYQVIGEHVIIEPVDELMKAVAKLGDG